MVNRLRTALAIYLNLPPAPHARLFQQKLDNPAYGLTDRSDYFPALLQWPEISDTGVILKVFRTPESVIILGKPGVPAQAGSLRGVQAADCRRNLALALHYLQSKTGGCMPGYEESLVRDSTTLF